MTNSGQYDKSAPPYGTVIKVAEAYERLRQRLGFGSYTAFNWASDPMEQRNWVHFERCASCMLESDCQDEAEWVRAQCRTDTREVYTRPEQLYSPRSEKNYRELVAGETSDGRVRVQFGWLAQYRQLFPERSDAELVMNPQWGFDSWFRVLYADVVPAPIAIAAAQELRQSSSLRNAIAAANVDLGNLEKKIQSHLR